MTFSSERTTRVITPTTINKTNIKIKHNFLFSHQALFFSLRDAFANDSDYIENRLKINMLSAPHMKL